MSHTLIYIALCFGIVYSQNSCKWSLQYQGQSVSLDLSALSGLIIYAQEEQYTQFYVEYTPCQNNVSCTCYNSGNVMTAQINNPSQPQNCNGITASFDSNTQPIFTPNTGGSFTFEYPVEPNVCVEGCDSGRQQEINFICDKNSTGPYNKNKLRFYETPKVNSVCKYHLDIYTKYACVNISSNSSNITDFFPYGKDSNNKPLFSTIPSKSYCTANSADSPCTEQFRCPWLNAGSDLFYQAALWDKQSGTTNGINYINQNIVAYYTLGTTGGNFPINPADKNQVGSCWHVKGQNSKGFGSFNQNDIILQDEGLGGGDSNADMCSIQGGCGDYNCCKISIPQVTYKAQCPAGTGPGYAGCGPSVNGETITNQYGTFKITDAGGCPHTFNGQNLNTMSWETICSLLYRSGTNNDAGPLYNSCMNEGPFMSTGADPVVAKRVRCPEGLIRLTGMNRNDNNNFPIAQVGTASTDSSYWEGGSKTVSAGGDCRIDTGNYDGDGTSTHMIFCGPQQNAQPGPISDLNQAKWGGNSAQQTFAYNVQNNSYLRDWVMAYGSIPIFYSDNVNGGDWTNEVDNTRLCY
eukprot:225795_1